MDEDIGREEASTEVVHPMVIRIRGSKAEAMETRNLRVVIGRRSSKRRLTPPKVWLTSCLSWLRRKRAIKPL